MSMEPVLEIIADAGWGFLASCDDGQPRVRPMVFVVRDHGVLWSSTYNMSGKAREFEHNSRVEICFLSSKFVQARIEGTLDATGGEEKKRALLEANPKVRNHFADEHDPQFVHLEIKPTRIRWKPSGFSDYHEVAL